MFKKILCLTLTLLMVVSCLPISAIAATAPQASGNSLTATGSIAAESSVYAVISVNKGVKVQGFSFRLQGLVSDITSRTAEWNASIGGSTTFNAKWNSSGTECMGSILFSSDGYTFSQKTDIVKIKLTTSSAAVSNQTFKLVPDEFYGYVSGSDMQDISTSNLDLRIESAATLSEITVSTYPTKMTYNIGDTFDYSGIKITGKYTDGSTSDETNKVTYSGFTSTAVGSKRITVTSTENTNIVVYFYVTVVDPIDSIYIDTMPTKTTYSIGDTFDSAGIVVMAKLKSGKTSNITQNVTYSGFSSATAGVKKITVTSTENTSATVSFNVTVANPLSSIKVTTKPTKLTYNIGDSFSASGIKVTGTYKDGTTGDVTGKVTYSGFSSTTTGTKTITVTYTEDTSLTDTFTVTVTNPLSSIEITAFPTKTSYFIGESFSSSGIKITGTYKNGSTADVTNNVTYTGFSSATVGTKTITVVSKENSSVTAKFTVTVSNPLVSIAVTTQPTKLTYVYGQAFSSSGAKITGTYKDGTTADLTSKVIYSGYSPVKIGTQKVSVISTDDTSITTEITVTVTNPLTGIEITTYPTKTSYNIGETFSSAGIKVTGTYKDNSTADVTSNVTYSGFSSTTTGTKTITVTSKENSSITTTFTVTVSNPLSSIKVTTYPTKTSYNIGESLNTSGIKITGTYKDGSTADVTSNVTYSGFSSTTTGTKTITVTSKENSSITTTFTVTVNNPLTSIKVTTNPTKTSYNIGETFSSAGIKVTGTYKDGSTADVTSNVTYSGFSSTTTGTKTITVTSKENSSITTTFTVTVNNPLSSIKVTTSPTKTSYNIGETFSSAGIKVTGTYKDGSTADVTSNVTYSGFSSTTTGTKTITVTSKENSSITTTFTVTVSNPLSSIKVTTYPTKTSYNIGETFSSAGIKVTGTYKDGSTADVTSNVTYSGFSSTTTGTKTITVTSKENSSITTTFTVTVNNPLTSIKVTTNPTKTSYNIGETFSSAGIKVTGTYKDGSTADVTSNVTYSGFSSTTTGTKTITVTSKENSSITTTFTVTVNNPLSSIKVTTSPTKTVYAIGESLNTSGIKITGTYKDGSTADVTSNVTYSGFSSTTTGMKTITVTSKENSSITTTFTVTVNNPLTSIKVTTNPTKTSYNIGETFSSAGIKVTGTYKDGTTADVTSKVKYEGFTSAGPGTKTVTVISTEYSSVTTTFDVTVEGVITNPITAIKITNMPSKTTYYINDEFSSAGIKVTGTFTDGTTADVTNKVSYKGFSSLTVGTKTITVVSDEDNSISTIFTVTVINPLSSIKVTSMPAKTVYELNEKLDVTGIKVTGTYKNGSAADVTDKVNYYGFTSGTVGTKTITVTSADDTSIKTTFTVSVRNSLSSIKVTSMPAKTVYELNEKLDVTGIKVTGTYKDGTTADVTDKVTYEGFTSGTVGTKTITVTSADDTSIKTTFTVSVRNSLSSIKVTSMPAKTVYELNEKLDVTGIKVTGTYKDGTTADVTDKVKYEGFTSAGLGTKTVTVISTEDPSLKTAFDVTVEGVITNPITSIQITDMPSKTTYYINDEFTSAGIKVMGTFTDGTTADVTSKVSYEGFSSAAIGTKKITVVSDEDSSIKTSFDITVINPLVSVKITAMPEKTVYELNEKLDVTGIKVTGTYKDGSTADVTDKVKYDGFTSGTVGTKTITVTSADDTAITATYNVTVVNSIVSIEIVKLPDKTKYFIGETVLDTTGIEVKGTFKNGSSADVSNKVSFSPVDSSRAGSFEINVASIENASVTAAFTVTIVSSELSEIRLEALPEKLDYYVGEAFEPKGIRVIAVYSNSGETDVTAQLGFSGFDSSSSGEKTVTVSFGEKTASFIVRISDLTPRAIKINSLPGKLSYCVGDSVLITDGISVSAIYSDNSTSDVTELVSYSGFDTLAPGEKTIIVTMNNYPELKAEFKINVELPEITGIYVASLPYKTDYLINENFVSDGAAIIAAYNNGDTENVTSDADFEGFDSSKAGKQTITVSYEGFTATFDVKVSDPSVSGISVDTKNAKKTYYIGEQFDDSGIVVTAIYSNGRTEDVSENVSFSGFSSVQAGSCAVSVVFGVFSDSFTVTVKEPEVKALNLVLGSVKREYNLGDEFTSEGLTAIAVYTNGSTKDVTEFILTSGFDSSRSGGQIITVSYGDKTANYTVNINENKLISISVTPPEKLEYYAGDQLDMTGYSVSAIYSNGDKIDVTKQAIVGKFDSERDGDQLITVTYGGKTGSFRVSVKEITLTGITVTPPKKTEYYAGENIDYTGISVTAAYSDGSSEDVTSLVSFEGFDSRVTGEQRITVSYGNKRAEFFVNVNDITLSGITVTPPSKKKYILGERIDLTGLRIMANYSDGTSSIVTSDYKVSGYDPTIPGDQQILVTYSGMTGSFSVTVIELNVLSLTLTPPEKRSYFIGAELDTAGMTVKAKYIDGSEADVTDRAELSGFDSSVPGSVTVTVSYGGKTEQFEVNITEISVEKINIAAPDKREYFIGDEFDPTGLIAAAVYSNGTTEVITDKAEITGFDSSKAGTQNIKVSFGGKSTFFKVTVSEVAISRLEVKLPKKMDYFIGEEFDPAGMTVTAVYNNGETADVTEQSQITGFDSNTAGAKVLTVSYEGKTASVTVSVFNITVLNITVTPPEKTSYTIGESFDGSGMTVNENYTDGSAIDVTKDASVSGFDSTTAGFKTIEVEYNGMKASFEVYVSAASLESITATQPNKKTYYVNEPFDPEGIIVTANYSDGTSEDVTRLAGISGFDSASAGVNNLVIAYGGKTVSVNVTILDITLTSIAVTPPLKTEYNLGDKFNPHGMIVTASYSDGTTEDVTELAEISGFNCDRAGIQTVTVSYNGQKASFEVTVSESSLVSISIIPPTRTNYAKGEMIDYRGMKVIAEYSNGETVDVTDMVTLISQPYSDTIEVEYGMRKASVEINRSEISITGITLTPPQKLEYEKGEELDLTGMNVTAHYSDGSSADVTEASAVEGFNGGKNGEQQITVNYSGFSETFIINIAGTDPELVRIEVTPPEKTLCRTGSELDLTGMKVTAVYSDGFEKDITGEAALGGLDSSTAGYQTAVVSYEDKTAEFEVRYYLLGDVNLDGVVNSADALTMLRISVKLETLPENISTEMSDMNSDGVINSEDALMALRLSVMK